MRQFAKLDLSIIDSSIWFQPDHVFRVWIVMLCKRDYRTGVVTKTLLSLARDSGRTIEETKDAVRVLMEPDEYSRTDTDDGRRIVEVKGGWRLLNHKVYNEMLSADEERARKKKWAAERRQSLRSGSVAVRSEVSTESSGVDPRSDLLSTISSSPDPEGSEEGVAQVNPKKGRFVPDDFEPNDSHRVRCQELKLDIAEVLRRFRLHEFNRDYGNWNKRFSLWIEDQKIRRETESAKRLSATPIGERKGGSIGPVTQTFDEAMAGFK